jgi:hypothetical protein
MKRITTVFLLLLYVTTTFGFSLQLHWCGQKISSVNLIFSEKHSCTCGTKEMKPSCCKNSVEYFKVKTDHQNSAISSITNTVTDLSLNQQCNYSISFVKENKIASPVFRPPPNRNHLPLFQLYRNILI